jgi:radical SAM superfamily enzyme YgiQ (UPF0313 family)
VTSLPDEALEHASSVVIGEGEPVWARLLDDFARGRLAPRYQRAPDEEFDLGAAPAPRYDLLDPHRYNRLLVQTSRGCPHRCDFCASSILLTSHYKVKPIELVVDEVRQIKSIWRRPFLEFADDNSFCRRAHYRRLCDALAPERVRWFTETDISIVDDPELLDGMREAGCRQVLIGLESPVASGLRGIEQRGDWKLRQRDRYEHAVRAIQSRGIGVNGCFILGLDGDTEGVFDEVYGFAQRVGLFDVQITVLTPFPGTPLYARLLGEGRILAPGAWERCTLFDVNFIPRHMSADHLQRGLLDLARRLYHPDAVTERRSAFLHGVRHAGAEGPEDDLGG